MNANEVRYRLTAALLEAPGSLTLEELLSRARLAEPYVAGPGGKA